MVRHLLVKQFQVYWISDGEAGPRQAVPSSAGDGGSREHLIRPLDCALRLLLGAPVASSSSAETNPSLDIAFGTERLELQVSCGKSSISLTPRVTLSCPESFV